MCEFVVGQRVICVNDDLTAFLHIYRSEYIDQLLSIAPNFLPVTKGLIYTISKINLIEKSEFISKNHYTLLFEEVPLRNATDSGYLSERFAPIRKTNIDIFNKMLNPNKDSIMIFEYEELLREVLK